jgi:predicted nucleic acid-binding protein
VKHVLHVFYVATARNITLTLDEELLREARVLAAQRGLSVSAFLRKESTGLVERQRGYRRRATPRCAAFAAVTHSGVESSLRGKSCTTVPSFVDTNILVYAEDRDAKNKHTVARDLIVQLWDDHEGVLSIQVLQEFYVNVTRKLKKPLSSARALDIVAEYLTWTVVENTGRLLTDAIALQQRGQLSF